MEKAKDTYGLFFGSFNPIHNGHMIIANIVRQLADLKEVWFVVTPLNPMKSSKSLLHEFDRLDMVDKAIYDDPYFRGCDVEFNLPRPSYTIDTLAYLSDKNPNKKFKLIIGEDNLHSFPRWKNSKVILENHGLLVYPRPNAKPSSLKDHKNVEFIEAPTIDISATFIRRLIKEGRSVKYLIPDAVWEFIRRKRFYC